MNETQKFAVILTKQELDELKLSVYYMVSQKAFERVINPVAYDGLILSLLSAVAVQQTEVSKEAVPSTTEK